MTIRNTDTVKGKYEVYFVAAGMTGELMAGAEDRSEICTGGEKVSN